MTSYRLRPKAVDDLESIGDYIALDDPARAVSFVDEILVACETIAAHPLAYQRRDDLIAGLRQAVFGRYLVMFTPDADGVVIERVVHGARRLEDLL